VVTTVELLVNGTLMRGDILHGNLEGARFVREVRTAPRYRLWSIGDEYPGMVAARPGEKGVPVAGEIYELTFEHLEWLVAQEPSGLGVGTAELEDGHRVLAVLWVQRELPPGAVDISSFGGWRAYRASATA
jgi:gamma-glutamylcyclotransferase (GGCT)/AIG2-like uncharacterized protein YtfP